MDEQALSTLISRTAVLMEQFERRCQALEQRQLALDAQLRGLAAELPDVLRREAALHWAALPTSVAQQVNEGVERAAAKLRARLDDAGAQVHHGARGLAADLEDMRRLQRHTAWKALAAVGGSILLLIAGGLWLANDYRREIEARKIRAELLRAYNAADVTLCGDRLCARLEPGGRGVGPGGRYRPVAPR